jgi:hypothetical protein
MADGLLLQGFICDADSDEARMPFDNNTAKQEIWMTKDPAESDCLRTLTGPEEFLHHPSYVATPQHLLDVTEDSCYMPNRARRTASTAAAGPPTSTCAASCRPKR